MHFFGLADHTVGALPDPRRAEEFLDQVLAGEPDWEDQLEIVEVELGT
jgi:hypothetical protein